MGTVQITFLGDIFLGENSESISVSPAVAKLWQQADLVVGNMEGPITARTEPMVQKCSLRSDLATAGKLKDWGLDVVSLANNHMFDYGWEGFADTRRALEQAGIAFLGAGENLSEAGRPLIRTLKGLRIALLAFSWKLIQTTYATQESFGCAPLDEEFMVESIQRAADQADAVIVLPHWGYCQYTLPTPDQVSLAGKLLSAGATAVIGHHSHVVQATRQTGGKLVAYSLGNFAFAPFTDRGRPVDITRENRSGAVLCVELTTGKVVSHQLHHTRETARRIEPDTSEARQEEMAKRTKPLVAEDYQRQWRRYVRARMLRRIIYWTNILNWRKLHKETLIGAALMFKGVFSRRR